MSCIALESDIYHSKSAAVGTQADRKNVLNVTSLNKAFEHGRGADWAQCLVRETENTVNLVGHITTQNI